MKYIYTIVLCLQGLLVDAAPLQLQWQSQMSMQPIPEEIIQEQLLALQQMQWMNQWNNNVYPSQMQKSDVPYIIIMPIEQSNLISQENSLLKNAVENKAKDVEVKEGVTENKDLDAVIVDAAESKPQSMPKKAILLIPNRGRLSIGGLISAIPFLPIEINVPDAISWIFNGISNIVSGIGQAFPFNRPTQTQVSPENMRLLLKSLQIQNQNKLTPILMLPEVAQTFPMLV
ncbi:unnamed protein product [Diatraea saccharalis]|uniref:Uncharacterized protein n=1 Tax=Diatraea saccharalis TaxID=40085 RepID=A0A9N9QXJ8_9NEOP|nr:unnamed protein product [Diatraea saccharalis]